MDELHKKASLDSNFMLLTGDLGFGVVEKFQNSYPAQFINCGVAEQNMIGMAAGLASEGKKVFVYSIANFPTFRCLEQIRNDICYHGFPVTIVAIGSGLSYGTLGYTHHAIEDIGIMRALPGIRILSPIDPPEVINCLQLINDKPMPTYLRLGKNGEPSINNDSEINVETIKIHIKGKQCLVISTGTISDNCKVAVENINSKESGDVGFATITQIKPFIVDPSIFHEYTHVVTVEEHSLNSGFGSIVNDYLISNQLNLKVLNIGIPDKISHMIGSSKFLRSVHGLDVISLVTKITNFSNS
jgi:transketolase